MEGNYFEAAMAQAGGILRREPPFKRHEQDTYSKTVRSAFETVGKARSEGFSFAQICAALEKAGLLPREANPHSFRQAFHREETRRKKEEVLLKLVTKQAEPKGQTAPQPAPPERKQPQTVGAETASASEEAERERIRRMTSRVVDTGTGKIIIRSNGTFDYD